MGRIIDFLKEAEAGTPVKELCRKHGFSDAGLYGWRSCVGRMEVVDAAQLRNLEAENSRLKKLLAEAHWAVPVFKDTLLRCLMEPEVFDSATQEVFQGVQA